MKSHFVMLGAVCLAGLEHFNFDMSHIRNAQTNVVHLEG
jgi:hypothetical protein